MANPAQITESQAVGAFRLKRRQIGTETEYAWIWDATGELKSPIFNSIDDAQSWIGPQLGRGITVHPI